MVRLGLRANLGQFSLLVLVGCGTFDLAARARFKATIDMGDALRARIAALAREIPDPDRRLARSATSSCPWSRTSPW